MDTRRVSPLKIPYTSVRLGKRYFEPRGRMLKHGFAARPLGDDNEQTRAKAWRLVEAWRASRMGRTASSPADAAHLPSAERTYPRRSIGAAWQEWIRMDEWRRLALSNRTKIWWPAWLKRIEPTFGDCDPDTITMALVSAWRSRIAEVSGPDAAHKAMKVWRALWRVMQALRYTQLSDPSAKVDNPQPAPRHQSYDHREAMARAVAAWRMGYKGLAALIVVAWDTGFSPIDARTLRRRHMAANPKTGRIIFDKSKEGRAKSGVAVIGTLSRFGDLAVRKYLRGFGAGHTPESLLFRMRCGAPYGESTLGRDFAAVRAARFPGDKRQLRDLRRSGVIEAFTGGGDARAVSEKYGNTLDHSSALFRTYNPVNLEKVLQTDAARIEGRRRNKN